MTNTNDSQKPSLLVVDDEESVRTPLNYAFKQQYNMFLCSNSAEALAVVRSQRIHVAILDIKMTNESGLDLLVALKKVDPFIEVIMLTGFGTMDYMKTAWDHDAFAFSKKPFDIPELTMTLERAVRLRRATEATQVAMEKAKLVDTGLFEIQAGVIHDLRNILTAPMGIIELMTTDLSERTSVAPEEMADLCTKLKLVDRQLQTCATLCVRHLQIIKSATNSPASIESSKVDEIMSELAASLHSNFEFRNTRLRVVIARGPLPRVAISPVEVYQILLNLVMNAAQSTDRLHDVLIEGRLRTTPVETEFMVDSEHSRVVGLPTFRNESPFVVATITDTGDGISPATLAKLFSGLHTTKAEGTGVGLSLISKFVQRNRCLLYVETNPGKGTSVTIYFPIGFGGATQS
jgi:signal transduction histidine kinase